MQVAGYVVEYTTGLTYATIKGAGMQGGLGAEVHSNSTLN